MDKLDAFLDNLQEQIFDEARQSLGENGFDRWRNPRYMGKMDNPDAYARVKGSCGDTMEMYFKFKNNRVLEGSYVTDGCASSSVSGSFGVELALGKTPDELVDIDGEEVLKKIGRLPDADQHCAFLVAQTIHDAVTYYMNTSDKND